MGRLNELFTHKNNKVYIIAEIGVNHNGNLELAKQSIDAAKDAGADAVKFQTFKSEKLVSKYAEKANYQQKHTDSSESQLNMLKKLELTYEEFCVLRDYALDKNVDFLSTPFDEESAYFLKDLGVDAFKIGSGDLNNLPFIETIDSFGLPIILSTGMSSIEEVRETLQIIRKSNVALLHCTSNYPAPIEDVNLKAMRTMKDAFDTIIGYSDHTEGNEISIGAVALGAKIIEKHFTLDKNLPGPDHKASLDPIEFKVFVEAIRRIEISLGDGIKRCMPSEINTRQVARKSIVVNKDLYKGQIIEEDDISIKRPGNGIEPKYFKELIGKKVNKAIKADQLIQWTDIE